MPSCELTADFLTTLPARLPCQGVVCFFDTELKGFLLELRVSGGATYYFRYRDADGKVRLNWIGRVHETSLGEARVAAHKMSQLLAEGGDPKRERLRLLGVPCFGQFVAQHYLPFIKSRKRSWRTDDSILRGHLLPAFAHVRLNRISRADVLALHHAKLESGYAAATCNRMLILLKFIFNCATRWDFLPPGSNPCSGIEAFADHGARERFLTTAEVQRLMAALDASPQKQVAHVIRLLLYTGARKREILDCRWDEIDFERQLLTVPATRSKSKKLRLIPLSDAAIELLRTLPREAGIPWVFFNPRTGKPPVSIFYAWDTIRRKVQLGDVRLHDLRHSYASFLINAGRTLYEVQRLLGHHDPKVTMRYAHLSPQSMRDAVNLVADLVRGPA